MSARIVEVDRVRHPTSSNRFPWSSHVCAIRIVPVRKSHCLDPIKDCGPFPGFQTVFCESFSCTRFPVRMEDFRLKRSRFTEQQIAFALQQVESGTLVGDVCRKMGGSEQTLYRWKKRFGGLMPSEVRRLKRTEEENVRLRRLVADLSLDQEMLQEVIRKKL